VGRGRVQPRLQACVEQVGLHTLAATQGEGRRSNNTRHSANVSSSWCIVRLRLSHIP
jgi:hypothetical protein